MKFYLPILALALLQACTSAPPPAPKPPLVQIDEVKPNRWTAKTKQNLLHLFQVYDLAPFVFTSQVRIESMVVPHSHPVLTLNSRYADQPYKLLSVFLHEELHWWAVSNGKVFDAAIARVRQLFPTLPAKSPALARSTYLHLLICFLEYEAVAHYLGKDQADEILEELITKDKIYPWVYTQVREKHAELKRVVAEFNLAPAPLK